ncbi:unnamed protein product, partial [Ilex paraguariensis]
FIMLSSIELRKKKAGEVKSGGKRETADLEFEEPKRRRFGHEEIDCEKKRPIQPGDDDGGVKKQQKPE